MVVRGENMDVMTGSDDAAVCPTVLTRGSLQRLVVGLLSSCDTDSGIFDAINALGRLTDRLDAWHGRALG